MWSTRWSARPGLAASVAALEAGKRLALANKESLVMAGDHLMRLAAARPGARDHTGRQRTQRYLPVPRTAAAVEIDRIVITASGGPFRGFGRERLAQVTFAEPHHPTWTMGPKITVDSASLANKGLEVIEAHFLFGLGYDRISKCWSIRSRSCTGWRCCGMGR